VSECQEWLVCTKCNQRKPSDKFIKDKRKKNGLGSWCRVCSRSKRTPEDYVNSVLKRLNDEDLS